MRTRTVARILHALLVVHDESRPVPAPPVRLEQPRPRRRLRPLVLRETLRHDPHQVVRQSLDRLGLRLGRELAREGTVARIVAAVADAIDAVLPQHLFVRQDGALRLAHDTLDQVQQPQLVFAASGRRMKCDQLAAVDVAETETQERLHLFTGLCQQCIARRGHLCKPVQKARSKLHKLWANG